MKPLVFYIFILSSTVATGAVLQVPGQYNTIQQAINAATTGDSIRVEPGVYTENINFMGKNITVGSDYLFTGSETAIANTIIDGSSAGITANERSTVTFENQETNASMLCGFTIRGGNGNARLFGFHFFYYGGGVFCNGASPTLRSLNITGNAAECGGGVFLYSSNAVLENSTVQQNACFSMKFEAPNAGGGIAIWGGNPMFVNDRIVFNRTAYAAGGVYTMLTNARFVNTLIANNQSESMGCAVYADMLSDVGFTNCTIAGNLSNGVGNNGAIYGLDSARVNFRNTIFWGNTPAVIMFQGNYSRNSFAASYSNVENGLNAIVTNNNTAMNWGSGNIMAWPAFTDSTTYLYDLLPASPSINTGDTTGISGYIPAKDLGGNPRYVHMIDMGAYEAPLPAGIPTMPELQLSVYPNPATDRLYIGGADAYKKLSICLYTMDGKKLRGWSKLPGAARWVDISDIARGVYVVEIGTEDGKYAQQLMIK